MIPLNVKIECYDVLTRMSNSHDELLLLLDIPI